MIINALILHVVLIILGVPLWKHAKKRTKEAGGSAGLAIALMLSCGVLGYYALLVGRDAQVRRVRGAEGWLGAALTVALLPEAFLALAEKPLLGISVALLLWLVFHTVYSAIRPRLSVTAVETRAKTLSRWKDPRGDLLQVRRVVKHFPQKGGLLNREQGAVRAVDGVSLNLEPGETLGLVGESGCGKSTLGRVILRLLEPTRGDILYRGIDLASLAPAELQAMRKEMQIVFQDPYSSLNPRMTVDSMLREALHIHDIVPDSKAGLRVGGLLERVGLRPDHAGRYPHEFSGGQRQRLGIARALAVEPKMIVCDEPVSALDVSVQAQIVNLLMDLQKGLGIAYLFIAHDLNIVEHISDRVAVMYLGRIVELADRDAIYTNPRHPYTRALLSAIPVPDPTRAGRRNVLRGDVPSPANPPGGCRFHPRCPEAVGACSTEEQELRDLGGGHRVACRRRDELPAWRVRDVQDKDR